LFLFLSYFVPLRIFHVYWDVTIVIMTLFAITNYHWSVCWMICFTPFVRLLFSYWLWGRIIPYTQFRLRTHGGCDRSTEDAYSFMAPNPTFVFVEGLCSPIHSTCIWCFGTEITFNTLLTSASIYWKATTLTYDPLTFISQRWKMNQAIYYWPTHKWNLTLIKSYSCISFWWGQIKLTITLDVQIFFFKFHVSNK
jgi:hypothetical protein